MLTTSLWMADSVHMIGFKFSLAAFQSYSSLFDPSKSVSHYPAFHSLFLLVESVALSVIRWWQGKLWV
jgi:hypothetical protein